ncbi:MAG: acetate kinase, partial [Traorella sp.]
MTKIISVNAGSSSLKFQLFDMPSEKVLTSGNAERIGLDEGIFTIKVNGEKYVQKLPIPDHGVAVDLLLKALVNYKVVESLDEIKGAGHRIVQGGSYFSESAFVDEDVVNKVEELAPLAPLHNPAHLIGYRAFKNALPSIGHVFVFDTAFHQSMKPDSFLYPLP